MYIPCKIIHLICKASNIWSELYANGYYQYMYISHHNYVSQHRNIIFHGQDECLLWEIMRQLSQSCMMTSSNGNLFRVTGHLCGDRGPVNSPHKGQWRGALMFTLICARIKGWVNNREAGDLRRYLAHYDVIVMMHDIGKSVLIMNYDCTWKNIFLRNTCGEDGTNYCWSVL